MPTAEDYGGELNVFVGETDFSFHTLTRSRKSNYTIKNICRLMRPDKENSDEIELLHGVLLTFSGACERI